jgi:tetratricopeptide (TPR) repeat protein
MMAQAQYHAAADALEPLAGQSCDPRASLLLAAAFDAQGDSDKAKDALERAHARWPSNNSIAASLAHEYMSGGETGKAANALKHFIATATTPQQELEEAVLVDFASHQLEPAHTAAAAAYKAYPSLHSLLLLANALQLEGRYPDVNGLLADKRTTYADSPEFFITLAESESDAGIFPDARKDLERAIALNAKSPQAHYLLGYVQLRTGAVDQAIGEFDTAIDLGYGQPRTYYQLALALRSKPDESAEIQALQQALAADSHYAPAQCELGRILLEQHNAAEAVSHLTAAIEYNPRAEEGYFLLAKAYAGLGEKDKSDAMVKRLIEVRKENRTTAANKSDTHSAGDPASRP